MKTIRILAVLVLVIQLVNMGIVLAGSGMGHGAGFDTFLAGMRDPWQNFINNDLVMGLLFTMSWIVFRERGNGVLQTVAWVWMAAWWGNIVIAVYVLKAVSEAKGSWPVFFMRGHAPGAQSFASFVIPGPLRMASLAGAALVIVYLVYGLLSCRFAAIPAIGYVAGFVPVALSLALLGRPRGQHRLAA